MSGEPPVPSYAVVVLYYRHGAEILSTVRNFLHQSPPPQEVIVVDNASADGVCADVLRDLKQVRVVPTDRNLGYSGGMRHGLKSVDPSIRAVMFATHEVRLSPGSACAMLQTLSASAAAQVGPIVTNAFDGTIWSYGGELTLRGSARHRKTPGRGDAYPTTWIDGCCYVAPNTQNTLDAFSEDYFLYWEDVDLSISLNRFGPVMVATRAHATQTTGKTPPYYRARNQILFWRKRKRFDKAALASAEAFARAVKFALTPRTRPISLATVAGGIDGWTGRLRLEHGGVRY